MAEVTVPFTPLISIIDDDEAIRDATATLVRSLGYEARAYESAEAFLSAPDADASTCLIVDVQMPGMNGIELQQELLRRPDPKPILFITAFADIEMRGRALAAGAVNVLGKPCDDKLLIDSIQFAVGTRQP